LRESVLSLKRQKKGGNVVGVDIEAGSVAAAEVRGRNGTAELAAAGIEALPPGALYEGEVADSDTLVASLKSLFSANKLSKQVRLGIGNQRVIVRTVRLPAIEDPKEMEAAVRFQAQEQMPMPLDQAVLEYQVVGGVPAEEGGAPQVDVVVVAARQNMISSFIRPLREAGLDPVGVDLSAFGMIRALASSAAAGPTAPGDGEQGGDGAAEVPARAGGAVLYCSVGDVMNLAVARGRACLFTRVATTGLETIGGRLASERGLTPEHATQWLAHVGLERPLDQVEGDSELVAGARRVLEEGVGSLVDELRLSLDYYGAQESAVAVDKVVLCGPGSAIPGLPAEMESRLGVSMVAARPSALSGYDEVSAARLTLPYGLAQEA
jgi:type IV pilus assembly protein PilM